MPILRYFCGRVPQLLNHSQLLQCLALAAPSNNSLPQYPSLSSFVVNISGEIMSHEQHPSTLDSRFPARVPSTLESRFPANFISTTQQQCLFSELMAMSSLTMSGSLSCKVDLPWVLNLNSRFVRFNALISHKVCFIYLLIILIPCNS